MLVSLSVDIKAPPEVVWPYLVEPEKAKQWFTALKKYKWQGKVGGVGSGFYWYEEAAGKTYNIWFETTEWEPNAVFGYRMTKGDFFKSYDERWEIDKTDIGCKFTFNDHIEFPYGPVGKFIGIFAAKNARKEGPKFLNNLKKLAEAENNEQ